MGGRARRPDPDFERDGREDRRGDRRLAPAAGPEARHAPAEAGSEVGRGFDDQPPARVPSAPVGAGGGSMGLDPAARTMEAIEAARAKRIAGSLSGPRDGAGAAVGAQSSEPAAGDAGRHYWTTARRPAAARGEGSGLAERDRPGDQQGPCRREADAGADDAGGTVGATPGARGR